LPQYKSVDFYCSVIDEGIPNPKLPFLKLIVGWNFGGCPSFFNNTSQNNIFEKILI
jgi:hypothetical protein